MFEVVDTSWMVAVCMNLMEEAVNVALGQSLKYKIVQRSIAITWITCF